MAEISMLVTSIDPLAPYKVSDDLMLELLNVTATVEDGLEWPPFVPAVDRLVLVLIIADVVRFLAKVLPLI